MMEYTVFSLADTEISVTVEDSLNLMSAERWRLVGIYPVGNRVKYVMERAKVKREKVVDGDGEHSDAGQEQTPFD